MTATDLDAAGVDLGKVSDSINFGGLSGDSNMNWCVYVTIDSGKGTLSSVSYSAVDGMVKDGTC